jgi:hypothetical protein
MDLNAKIEASIESTTDVTALEALNAQQAQVDDVLQKDDICRLAADTQAFNAVAKQVSDANNGLKILKGQIEATASHFATADKILAAISKVLTLVPGI